MVNSNNPHLIRDTDLKTICGDSRLGEVNFLFMVPILEKIKSAIVELENLHY